MKHGHFLFGSFQGTKHIHLPIKPIVQQQMMRQADSMRLHRVSTAIIIVPDIWVIEIFHNPVESAVRIMHRGRGHGWSVGALFNSLLIRRSETVECSVTRKKHRACSSPAHPAAHDACVSE